MTLLILKTLSLTRADFEAAVVEALSVVILVSTHEDIGEAGLAHPSGAQDDHPGAGEPVLVVVMRKRSCKIRLFMK